MRPITDVLRDIRRGRAVEQATSLLAEIVRAVDETGKSGSVTMTLTVKPEKGGGSQKTLSVSVSCKKPQMDIPEAVFFSDADGDLHRSDPTQTEMFNEVKSSGVRGVDALSAG